jgi:hypothetical protein
MRRGERIRVGGRVAVLGPAFDLTFVALLVLAGCRGGSTLPPPAEGWKRITLTKRWTLEVPDGMGPDTVRAGWNDVVPAQPGETTGALAGANRSVRWGTRVVGSGRFGKSLDRPPRWGYRYTLTNEVQLGRRPFTSADSVVWSYVGLVRRDQYLWMILAEGLPGDSVTTLRIMRSAHIR